jgi:hypothetical protein
MLAAQAAVLSGSRAPIVVLEHFRLPMTVLFAFASPQHDTYFVGADNLESANGLRPDKIVVCWGRFAVAIHGADVMKEALQYASYFDESAYGFRHRNGSKPPIIASVQDVCDQVAKCLPRLVRCHISRLSAPAHKMLWMNQGGGYVVLDYQRRELFDVALIGPVSGAAQLPPKFSITRLAPEQTYRFGINNTTPMGAVSAAIAADPRVWAATETTNARRLVAQHGSHNVIGDLGASFTVRGTVLEFCSNHDTLDDFMTSYGVP